MEPLFGYWRRAVGVAWSDTQVLVGGWRGRAVEVALAVIAFLILLWQFPAQALGGWSSLLTALGALLIAFVVTFAGFLVLAPVKLEALTVSEAVELALTRRRSLAARVLDARVEEGSLLRDRLMESRRALSTPFINQWLIDVRVWQTRTLRTVRKCYSDEAVAFKAKVGPMQLTLQAGWRPEIRWPEKLDAELARWMAELERIR